MKWIWQQSEWPRFRYDADTLAEPERLFQLGSERLAGRFEALPKTSREDATIDLLLSEALKTSAIEGENLGDGKASRHHRLNHRSLKKPSLMARKLMRTMLD